MTQKENKPRIVIRDSKNRSLTDKGHSLTDNKPRKPFSSTRWSYPEYVKESKPINDIHKIKKNQNKIEISTLQATLPKERK